jgi:hypothetical protein
MKALSEGLRVQFGCLENNPCDIKVAWKEWYIKICLQSGKPLQAQWAELAIVMMEL